MKRREFTRNLLTIPFVAGMPAVLEAATTAQAVQTSQMIMPPGGSITDVPGLTAGHYTLTERPTGCTVVLCGKGATAGVDVRGSAPGTRETDLLNPINAVQTVNAIMLSGGSAYGLDAASGVMKFLEEKGFGVKVGAGVVPIVPAAILMDLGVGGFSARPNADAGYKACVAASSQPLAEGNIGAGAGATVGKMFGGNFRMKGGLGTSSHKVPGTDIVVAALVAVNAVGDVIDPHTGKVIAGARSEDGKGYRDSMAAIMSGYRVASPVGTNTTIGIVATNAPFTKTQMNKIASMAHDGYARAINPTHTMSDGDTIFSMSSGESKTRCDVTAIGAIAATVMARAIVRAVMAAESLPALNIPACRDYPKA